MSELNSNTNQGGPRNTSYLRCGAVFPIGGVAQSAFVNQGETIISPTFRKKRTVEEMAKSAEFKPYKPTKEQQESISRTIKTLFK